MRCVDSWTRTSNAWKSSRHIYMRRIGLFVFADARFSSHPTKSKERFQRLPFRHIHSCRSVPCCQPKLQASPHLLDFVDKTRIELATYCRTPSVLRFYTALACCRSSNELLIHLRVFPRCQIVQYQLNARNRTLLLLTTTSISEPS